MRPYLRSIKLPIMLLIALLIPSGSLADDRDHDRARKALEAGEILPLRTIIDKLDDDYPGQILEVELERDDGQWIYEVKQVREKGVVIKLKLDARDGTLLGIKGRDIAPAASQQGRP